MINSFILPVENYQTKSNGKCTMKSYRYCGKEEIIFNSDTKLFIGPIDFNKTDNGKEINNVVVFTYDDNIVPLDKSTTKILFSLLFKKGAVITKNKPIIDMFFYT